MTKPYNRKKVLPKLRAERNRLERISVSGVSGLIAKYITAAQKKLEKAIELLEKEKKDVLH